MLRNVAGYNVVVPIGEAALDFNGMINLNESGALLWGKLEKGSTEEDLVTVLLDEYETTEETAKNNCQQIGNEGDKQCRGQTLSFNIGKINCADIKYGIRRAVRRACATGDIGIHAVFLQ